jgi:phosphate transport system substrate-binding protein
MNLNSPLCVAAAVGALVMAGGSAFASNITGAGSTFVYPVLAKWADTYKKETGNDLNYQSIGSGGGIKQIKARTVTFGASDMPLEPKALSDAALVQFPIISGADVPVVNITGVKADELVLDGPTLANIFLGKITNWNDPAIAKLNPGVKLPSTAIVVVHRSDGSGTTFIFTNYLSKVSADWKSQVGANTSVEWPVGIGAKGNEGVANNVKQAQGSIGYVEYAYAKQNKMASVDMINLAGKKVLPSAESFQAAAANADWASAPNYFVILTNQPGATSWPIAGSTFILMNKKPQDPAAAGEALKFFSWAYTNGAGAAQALDYVPMPASVVGLIKKTWSTEIAGPDGKPVYADH